MDSCAMMMDDGRPEVKSEVVDGAENNLIHGLRDRYHQHIILKDCNDLFIARNNEDGLMLQMMMYKIV